jgi:hypothetical protein
MTCEEVPLPSNYHPLMFSPSEGKCKLSRVSAECVHSGKSVEDVGMIEEGVDISGRGKG